MNRRLAVRGIILNDKNELFCVRLRGYKASADGITPFWCMPGGGLDLGESLVDGIQREIEEELGVQPAVSNLLYIQQFTNEGREELEFFFHITNYKEFENADLSKTTHGATEIAAYGFIKPSDNHILPKFLTTEDITGHIDSSDPTKIFTQL